MTRSIVLLGGGRDSLGIIIRANEMGLRTVVVDNDPNAPGFAMADEKVMASCYDVNETLDRLRMITPPRAVLCAGTDSPHVMAAVAHVFRIVGPTKKTGELSRDKLRQHATLEVAGIRVPRLTWYKDEAGMGGHVDTPAGWRIMKPADSRGGRGVSRYWSEDDGARQNAYRLAKAASQTERVLEQEWIDGIQLSTESLVQGGRILWTSYAERNYSRLEELAPHVIEDGSDMPPEILSNDENDYEVKTNAALQACVEALGLTDGTLKGDIVWTGNEAVVIEVATRLSGGLFCSDMTPMCWGVDFVGMAIRIVLGETIYPGEIRPYLRGHVCQRFHFPPGKQIACHPDRGPSVITRGRTREEARERAREELEALLP